MLPCNNEPLTLKILNNQSYGLCQKEVDVHRNYISSPHCHAAEFLCIFFVKLETNPIHIGQCHYEWFVTAQQNEFKIDQLSILSATWHPESLGSLVGVSCSSQTIVKGM